METVSVSIVTPCYNGGPYLRATIESILAQSQPVLEMIIVDDGSTDESAAIAESFGPPIRVIRQVNQGESVARNRGIAEARGDYLLFLDADDLLDPDSLRQLVHAARRAPGAVVAQGCLRFESNPAQPVAITPATWSAFFPTVISTNLGPPHVCLYPTELVRHAGGYNASLQWSEDWDFVAQIALIGAPLISIPLIGAWYRQHPQSQFATTKLANRARGHAAVMARLATGLLERPQLLEAHGEAMVWALWTSLRRALEKGVGWQELAGVTDALAQLVVRGPAEARQGRLPAMIRLVGPRWACRLHGLVNRQSTWTTQAAAV